MTTIDLTRHVRTPAGERYFHKPIGTPIGGGGRGTQKVALKTDIGTILDAKSWEGRGAKVQAGFVVPKGRNTEIRGGAEARANLARNQDRISQDPADLIRAFEPTDAELSQAKAFWDAHKPSAADRESLSTDLGLDPTLSSKSVRELRKAIKSPKTSDDDRMKFKTELGKRVAVARGSGDAAKTLADALGDKLDPKKTDTDLAPQIGETLAAHPSLGPLGHVWDRVRLAGYNLKKAVSSSEAGDELPRIIARNISSVLIMGLMLHLGLDIPGLGASG